MNRYARLTMAFITVALLTSGIAGPVRAAETRTDVVSAADIQTQIDQQIDRQMADRQTIQNLLSRADVRKIAGTAGIDIRRVEAAAGMLSASELRQVAARADEATGVTGGTEKVTLSVVAIILILLLIILLVD